MHNSNTRRAEALLALFGDELKRLQRQPRVVLKDDSLDRFPVSALGSGHADKADDRAFRVCAAEQLFELRGRVQLVGFETCNDAHQPPDTGGKNSTSSPGPTIWLSGTTVSPMQARVRPARTVAAWGLVDRQLFPQFGYRAGFRNI